MDFKIHDTETLRSVGKFSMKRVTLSHDKFSGNQTDKLERVIFERGDSVGCLLIDQPREEVILVKQFRPGVAVNPAGDNPWTLEVVAGAMDVDGETPEDVILREIEEETPGIEVSRIEHLFSYYPSAGASSEKFHLFVANVDSSKVAESGGLEDHNEDIQVVRLSFQEFCESPNNDVITGSTLIACLAFSAAFYSGAI